MNKTTFLKTMYPIWISQIFIIILGRTIISLIHFSSMKEFLVIYGIYASIEYILIPYYAGKKIKQNEGNRKQIIIAEMTLIFLCFLGMALPYLSFPKINYLSIILFITLIISTEFGVYKSKTKKETKP